MRYLLLFFFFSGYSQLITYSGTLTDDSGMPIPGASICVKGTATCTQADFDGNYTIQASVGQELEITYLGMSTQYIKITGGTGAPAGSQAVQPVLSNDFANSVRLEGDTLKPSEPSGTIALYYGGGFLHNLIQIRKDKNNVYKFETGYNQPRLYLELYTEFIAGVPMRGRSFQNRFAQGRSIDGTIAYRGPETGESFSWGPGISTLYNTGNATPWYPGGDIRQGAGAPVAVFGANRFFRTSLENKTSLTARLDMERHGELKLGLTYRNALGNLPEVKNNDLAATLSYSTSHENHILSGKFNFNRFEDMLSNENFIHNKAIFANAVTPAHFDNRAATTLPNGLPRSFSQWENNPYYLLCNNHDETENTSLSISLSDVYSRKRIRNTATLLSQYSDRHSTGGNIPFAAQAATPDYADRREKYSLFSVENSFEYRNYEDSRFGARLNVQYQQRDFSRQYGLGFDGADGYPGAAGSQYALLKTQDRAEAAVNLNAMHEFREIVGYDDMLEIDAAVDGVFSSTYSNAAYGGVSAGFRWNDFISNVNVYGSAVARQYEPGLQNNNLYFNSLAYTLANFKQMRNHQELFTPNAATTTREKVYTVGMSYSRPVQMNLEIYQKKVADMYAPVNNGGAFSWLPAVDYEQKGLEFSASFDHPKYGGDHKVRFSHDLNFTMYENEVTGLSGGRRRIPFAGFADVGKNYIVGQPVGAIMGSAYQRDDNGNKIIGSDGFPLMAASPAIIGDPNPDFVLGFGSRASYKDFYLSVGFDWSRGGDLWDGTSQTLDYYGVSQATARQRDITGYVFKGVTQSGQPNTQPVSFYGPSLPVEQNRWVRYGVGGVAESAIKDAGFFRLHNVTIGYSRRIKHNKNSIGLAISAFVNNAFILSETGAAFANNTLFNSPDTSGLDYFNAPLQRMYGLSVAVKF
ncbi:carboxypeptidase-like regulatory domain-containing protein [uncultured Flavobacterium sp.]|uniref:carboxypeptidase-like regulatory domain-containing protein n=1 Tax=uncultured Flavobacterium sp. TaxID=165435 RepID=UPI0025D3E027|nr:carboxypeptidase-like regulatory domain-containing protein [uncultured Flavobacterium sp.]